jgi:hypothetical protein
MNDGAKWTETNEQPPPEGRIVLTMDSGGQVQKLIFENNLFWHLDRKMYVYYTPLFWKELSCGTADRKNRCPTCGDDDCYCDYA